MENERVETLVFFVNGKKVSNYKYCRQKYDSVHHHCHWAMYSEITVIRGK